MQAIMGRNGCIALHYYVHFLRIFSFVTRGIESEGIGAKSVRSRLRLCNAQPAREDVGNELRPIFFVCHHRSYPLKHISTYSTTLSTKEEDLRGYEDVKRHFIKKMCYSNKKVTGSSAPPCCRSCCPKGIPRDFREGGRLPVLCDRRSRYHFRHGQLHPRILHRRRLLRRNRHHRHPFDCRLRSRRRPPSLKSLGIPFGQQERQYGGAELPVTFLFE